MLYHMTHVHSRDNCPAVFDDKLDLLERWWSSLKQTEGVTVHGCFVSPTDHVIHVTIEADNFALVARAMRPLNGLGSGDMAPVIAIDDMIAAFYHRPPPQ